MAAHKKSHCSNGHPRTPENLTKARNCKICQVARVAAWRKANPGIYGEKHNRNQRGQRENLSPCYLNALVRLKTGLPASEITDEDRAERKRIVLEYRAKRQSTNKEAAADGTRQSRQAQRLEASGCFPHSHP